MASRAAKPRTASAPSARPGPDADVCVPKSNPRAPPQAAADVAAGVAGAAAIPPAGSPAGEVVDAVVGWVHGAIAADRKVTALKTLQVGALVRMGLALMPVSGDGFTGIQAGEGERNGAAWEGHGARSLVLGSEHV